VQPVGEMDQNDAAATSFGSPEGASPLLETDGTIQVDQSCNQACDCESTDTDLKSFII
jgi:hypothetical protein